MWNMKELGIYMVLCMSVIDCRLIPFTKPSTSKKATFVLPQDFLERNNLANKVKIPNRDFCTQMILHPEDQYVVLPWWYHYCMGLKDRDDRGLRGNVHFNEIHRHILNEAQAYKKKLREKQQKIAELKKLTA